MCYSLIFHRRAQAVGSFDGYLQKTRTSSGTRMLVLVFCKGWSGNDGRVNDSALFQKKAFLPQQLYYLCKQLFLQTIVHKDIPKAAECIPVRHLIAGLYAAEF